ncbi:MAG TPA: TetR/AcrR family transcriptional regulator [Spongiibacteraceae bacterium]
MAALQTVTKVERMTPRSAATRAKLIAVAEGLFAERGVEGVSLNEINRAAGQRNSNACQYHFGNKHGLIQALMEKHVVVIIARRNELMDRMETEGSNDLREVVRSFVYPVAEKLYDPNGGKEFIRIVAQILVPQTLSLQRKSMTALRMQNADRLTRAFRNTILHLGLPEPIIRQRILLAAMLLYHGLADHSQMLDATKTDDPAIDTELFVNVIEDSIAAVLAAPMSADTATRVQILIKATE